MNRQKHSHHSSHTISRYYPVSLWQRIHSAFTPLILVIVLFFVLQLFSVIPPLSAHTISPTYAALAVFDTLWRLFIAFVFALVLSIPLALFVEKSQLTERVFFPV